MFCHQPHEGIDRALQNYDIAPRSLGKFPICFHAPVERLVSGQLTRPCQSSEGSGTTTSESVSSMSRESDVSSGCGLPNCTSRC
jgi:hypothetical protein